MQNKTLSKDYSTNKIIFCSFPDIVQHNNCIGLKNYSNLILKELLNTITQETVFYLIENNQNEWLNKVQEQVKIIIDCNKLNVEQILDICQKK